MNKVESEKRLSLFLASFHLLSMEDLAAITAAFTYQEIGRNQPIIITTESNQRMYFVADGLLRQYITIPSVSRQDLVIDRGFVLPSTFCLSSASFKQLRMPCIHAETIKRTSLLYIDQSVLTYLFIQIPSLFVLFSQLKDHYFTEMERLNMILHVGNCQLRYEYYTQYFAAHIQLVPDKYIAPFLNISQSELCRIRCRMAKGKQIMAIDSPSFVD